MPLDLPSQFGHPRGVAGFLVGHVMAAKNRSMCRAALDALAPEPRDRILEIGYGPGVLVRLVAATGARVAGVDPSSEMLRQASRRNRAGIQAGAVDLRAGNAPGLPFGDGAFSKAVAVNVAHHLDDQPGAFRDVRRVLEPRGVFLVVVRRALPTPRRYRSPGLRPEGIDALARKLERAGFDVTLESRNAGREIAILRAPVRGGPSRPARTQGGKP